MLSAGFPEFTVSVWHDQVNRQTRGITIENVFKYLI
jgi:hypothetical protein